MSSWGRRRERREKIEIREKKEKEKEREKGRKGDPSSTSLQHSSNKTLDWLGSELVCAPRGRGSLLLWLFFV